MPDYASMSLERLLDAAGHDCACGRHHVSTLKYLKNEPGAIRYLPEALRIAEISRPLVVMDPNTERAAWPQAKAVLDAAGIAYAVYRFPQAHIEPDEFAIGAITMAYDPDAADGLLSVGSGVLNDCCRLVAYAVGRPAVAIATAPSMDGYASNSSAMIIGRIKTTKINRPPEAIIADTDILRQAPERMLWAGLGDMLSKYIALCEWRIDSLVNGEYYCEDVAEMVRQNLKAIFANADRLMQRDPAAVQAVMQGLVLSGVVMSFIGSSRPASGMEHYFSHIWEMMALERGTAYELHGIQVGVGTYLSLRVYEVLRGLTPDRQKALDHMAGFDPKAWEAEIRRVYGGAAEALLAIEKSARKNDPQRHAARLEKLLANWGEIKKIIRDEVPALETIESMMRRVGMPVTAGDLHVAPQDVRDGFLYSRDLRDKYMTTSMLWDLGEIEGIADRLFPVE